MAAMQVTTSTPNLCPLDRQALQRAYDELQTAWTALHRVGNRTFNGPEANKTEMPWRIINGVRVDAVFHGKTGYCARAFFEHRSSNNYNQGLWDAYTAARAAMNTKYERVRELEAEGGSLCAVLSSRPLTNAPRAGVPPGRCDEE